jgi:hypothetical protein
MNRPTDQTRVMLFRQLTERIADVHHAWRAIANSLGARWRGRAPTGRRVRASDDIVELDAYMLKDIGAPSWLISRAVSLRDAQPGPMHIGAARWWVRLLTIAGVAVVVASVAAIPAATACEASPQSTMEGVFTGELDRGVPVYRLPSISVTANRSTDHRIRSAQTKGAQGARRGSQGVPTTS